MTQFELTADGAGVVALVSCEETVNEEENSSMLAVTLSFKSSQWYGVTYWLEGKLGDITLDKTVHYVYLGAKNKFYPVEQTFYLTVPHETDGTGIATVTIDLKGATRTGSAGSGWRVQGFGSVPLTPIARASTVGAADADIGGVSVIAVSRKNSSYSHSLSYSFGSLTGFIAEDGTGADQPVYCTATAIPFKVPEAFYYELTSAKAGVCTVTCTTYKDQTQVGLPMSCSFAVHTREDLCKPILTASVADVNEETVALTGDANVLVRFCSRAQLESLAQGQFGATVLSKTPDGVVEEPESDNFSFYALDSRGYETALSLSVPMIPYVMLTANASCNRNGNTDNTATLTVRGSYYNGSFGKQENHLTVVATVGGRIYNLDTQVFDNSYVATCVLEDMDYTSGYVINLYVSDALTELTPLVQLRRGVPVFDWGRRDFAFHVPITAPMINGVTNVALKAWPVGSVIMTADDRSPADTMGGTWQKLENMGLDLYFWQRLKSVDLLGTGLLGSFVLGDEV